MKRLWKNVGIGFIGGLAILTSSQLRAAEPTLTKIVVQIETPNAAGESILSDPKTVYRGGDKYSRLEEKLDPKVEDQTLIITSEPDYWIVNVGEKTGRHQVDRGPKFNTQLPIFWTSSEQPEPDFVELEFAKEMDFFGKDRSLELKPRTVDGRKCSARSIKTGEHEAILLLNPKTGKPLQIQLIKFGRLVAKVHYLSYETNLPFKGSLFHPPADVAMTEAE